MEIDIEISPKRNWKWQQHSSYTCIPTCWILMIPEQNGGLAAVRAIGGCSIILGGLVGIRPELRVRTLVVCSQRYFSRASTCGCKYDDIDMIRHRMGCIPSPCPSPNTCPNAVTIGNAAFCITVLYAIGCGTDMMSPPHHHHHLADLFFWKWLPRRLVADSWRYTPYKYSLRSSPNA